MRWTQKLILSVCFCLSVVMVTRTFIRVASLRVRSRVDLVWGNYWAYVEACTACIMASMSTFRTLFVKSGSRVPKKKPRGQYYLTRKLLLRKSERFNRYNWEEMNIDHGSMPQIPSATLSGVRTYIHSNNCSAGATTAIAFAMDPLDEDMMTQSNHDLPLMMAEHNELSAGKIEHGRKCSGETESNLFLVPYA